MKKNTGGKKTKRDELLKIIARLDKRPYYRNCPDGSMRLFNRAADTGIAVRRSRAGYSRFAKWYVTDGEKIKKDFPASDKDAAMAKGVSLCLEKLGNEIMKHNGGKNG
jgi:hypothetical protein